MVAIQPRASIVVLPTVAEAVPISIDRNLRSGSPQIVPVEATTAAKQWLQPHITVAYHAIQLWVWGVIGVVGFQPRTGFSRGGRMLNGTTMAQLADSFAVMWATSSNY
ncbi:hypothetical protein H4582DRAFT_1962748 [Lactarius indigo]|nr:hypothetical protein H4582DRAFT_1962748 [Lactarius indigo]